MANFIDANTGRPLSGEHLHRFTSRLDAAEAHAKSTGFVQRAEEAQAAAVADGRLDSRNVQPAHWNFVHDWMQNRQDSNSAHVDAFVQIHRTLHGQPYAPVSGYEAFAADTSTPFGFREYELGRINDYGKAARWRGGNQEIPSVDYDTQFIRRPISYFITSYRTDMFSRAHQATAGLSESAQKARIAALAIRRHINRVCIWEGDSSADIWGIKNYPHLPRKFMAHTYTQAGLQAAGKDAIAQDWNELLSYPSVESLGAYTPTRVRTTTRVLKNMAAIRMGDGSDETLLSWIKKTNYAGITMFEVADELRDFGGDGVDGIFVYNDGPTGYQHKLVQAVTALPPQTREFSDITYVWAAHGGMVALDPGNSVLALAQVK